MLSISPTTRIFVALEPVDMRAGFNRLYALVETRLNQNPPVRCSPLFGQKIGVLKVHRCPS